jgi:hypothetical protein
VIPTNWTSPSFDPKPQFNSYLVSYAYFVELLEVVVIPNNSLLIWVLELHALAGEPKFPTDNFAKILEVWAAPPV